MKSQKVQLMTIQIDTAERKAVLTIIWTETRKRHDSCAGRWAPTQEPSMLEKDVPRFDWHVGRLGVWLIVGRLPVPFVKRSNVLRMV